MQRRLAPFLRPAATLYGAAMRLRSRRYTSGVLGGTFRASCPVISVGNISWGGTGKTPIVDFLLGYTAKKRLRTVVLTRGYRAVPPSLPFPVPLDADPLHAGDEPLMLARRHPEALVVVDPKRRRAAAWAEKNASPKLFLLDDGMQHLAMERDLDCVLLRPDDLLDGWNKVIPSGTWREDKSALSRAHAFLMKADAKTLASLLPVIETRLAPYKRPFFSFDLCPAGLTRLAAPGNSLMPDTDFDLEGGYTLLCGTGDPVQVKQTASVFIGSAPVHEMLFPDHHAYAEEDAHRAAKPGLPIVCTAKDAVKLTGLLPFFNHVPVWVLEVQVRFGPSLFIRTDFDQWLDGKIESLLSMRFR